MEGQNIILNALTQQLLAKDKQIEMLLQTNAHLVDEIKNLVAERDSYLATGKTQPSKPQTQSAITTTTTTTKATSQGNKKRKLTDELEPSTPQKAVAASEKSQRKVATPPPPVLIDAEKSGEKEAPKSPAAQSGSTAAQAKKRKRKGSETPTAQQPEQQSNGNEKSAKKNNNTASTSTPEKPSADKAVQQQKPPKKKKKAEPAAPERPVDVDKIKKQTKAKEGGLAWVDSVVGTGAVASPGKKLVVTYKGYLRNGKMFDESSEKGFAFRLGFNQVIAGWEKGLIGMRVGGKRKLVIPPQFAYGNKSLPQIPANSTLCFDIELVSVA